jgi:hypothetical protein
MRPESMHIPAGHGSEHRLLTYITAGTTECKFYHAPENGAPQLTPLTALLLSF